jgi:hypothetical protein
MDWRGGSFRMTTYEGSRPCPISVILSDAPDEPCRASVPLARSEGSTVRARGTSSPIGPGHTDSRSFSRRESVDRGHGLEARLLQDDNLRGLAVMPHICHPERRARRALPRIRYVGAERRIYCRLARDSLVEHVPALTDSRSFSRRESVEREHGLEGRLLQDDKGVGDVDRPQRLRTMGGGLLPRHSLLRVSVPLCEPRFSRDPLRAAPSAD